MPPEVKASPEVTSPIAVIVPAPPPIPETVLHSQALEPEFQTRRSLLEQPFRSDIPEDDTSSPDPAEVVDEVPELLSWIAKDPEPVIGPPVKPLPESTSVTVPVPPPTPVTDFQVSVPDPLVANT